MTIGYRLRGRTAFVTGAGSGIGRAVARRLSEEGAWIACVDRDRAGAEAVAATLKYGGRALAVDISNETGVSGGHFQRVHRARPDRRGRQQRRYRRSANRGGRDPRSMSGSARSTST